MNKIVPVFDGHNDTLTEFFKDHSGSPTDLLSIQKELDIDLPRAKSGEFWGGLFGIYTPPFPGSEESTYAWGLKITKNGYTMKMPSPLDPKYAKDYTNQIVKFASELEDKLSDRIAIIKSFKDLSENWEKKLSIILHIEGAECVDSDLSNLEDYYLKGIRSIGPVWSRPNVFGNGVPFAFPRNPNTGDGLTSAGIKLVKKCNELGVIVDLAHINEKGFFDVARTSNKPLVVSHAGIYKICPSTRNLTDTELKEIKRSNGIVGIIFEPINTRPDGKMEDDTPLSVIAKQIVYVIEKIGINHVGFGSDFDGAQTPNDMKDVSKVQNLINELRKEGLNNEEIEKVAYQNWIRVLKETLK
jgi:membrane dipeptidase